MKRVILAAGLCAAVVGAMATAPEAQALPATFSFSDGPSGRAASATFDNIGGGILQVTLTNTATDDVLAPTDVLTAVFFNVLGTPTLSPGSAVIGPGGGTYVYDNSGPSGAVTPDAGLNVGGEWSYGNNNVTGAILGGGTYGFTSTGAPGGIQTSSGNLGGSNLWKIDALDGVQAGIVNIGDDPDTGNGGLSGVDNTTIVDSVVFQITGWDDAWLPGLFIQDVSFLYGTALSEPQYNGFCLDCDDFRIETPEPASAAILGIGLMALAGISRRRRRRA